MIDTAHHSQNCAAVAAQIAPAPAAPASTAWNPAADYITAGQDEPGYRSWYLAMPSRAVQVKAFNQYLATYQVAGLPRGARIEVEGILVLPAAGPGTPSQTGWRETFDQTKGQ